jgi:O-antigen chain-terminating methyltransferase
MSSKKPYPIRVLSTGARLPKYIQYFEKKTKETDERLERIESSIKEIKLELQSLGKITALDNKLSDLQSRINLLLDSKQKEVSAEHINNTVSDNHTYDNFYKLFEDKFRGSEEIIEKRVAEHLPHFVGLPGSIKKKPIVDIGCGRGELLKVLGENGFEAIGIDMNADMVRRAKTNGLDAIQTDALTYLRQQNTGSIAAITGFHIVEHIPFESLMQIFEESYRVLAYEGFVLFETPNPKSLTVGANTFYLDPSHQRPIPPELLAFMLEFVGFTAEIIPLHQIHKTPAKLAKPLAQVFESVFGFADYAVIGRKAT